MHAGCGHAMCRACWQTYINIKITEADVASMRCAAPECKMPLPNSLLRSMLSAELWIRLQSLLDDAHVATTATLCYCPEPTCGQVLLRTPGSEIVTCTCGGTWCPKCGGAPHWPANCDQVPVQSEFGKLEWGLAETKRCPNCSTVIEKNGGCPHMTCRQCKAQFCWVCGQYSMTIYPHHAGVPCQKPTPLSLFLPRGRSIDVGAVERNYHHAVQAKHCAAAMAHGLALESALVLRHVEWKLQGGPRPHALATVLESLIDLHIKADTRVVALRRGKNCRSLCTRYVTLVRVLYSRLSEL